MGQHCQRILGHFPLHLRRHIVGSIPRYVDIANGRRLAREKQEEEVATWVAVPSSIAHFRR